MSFVIDLLGLFIFKYLFMQFIIKFLILVYFPCSGKSVDNNNLKCFFIKPKMHDIICIDKGLFSSVSINISQNG